MSHLSGKIIIAPVKKVPRLFPSLGIAIPFQPTMSDQKSLLAGLCDIIERVEKRIKNRYSRHYSNNVVKRLKELLGNLNFTTHRKSIALLLSPNREKIFYLAFPVFPFVLLRKSVSLLDLIPAKQKEICFYLVVLTKSSIVFYQYRDGQVAKVYEQDYTGFTSLASNWKESFQKASVNLQLLNRGQRRPVFVTGKKQAIHLFLNAYPFSEIIFKKFRPGAPNTEQAIEALVSKMVITVARWQPKFMLGQVRLAQQTGTLVADLENVLPLLSKSENGLLLIDKRLQQQIQRLKPTAIISSKKIDLIHQIEYFLERGNQMEITKPGLLKKWGGIVLLPAKITEITTRLSSGLLSEDAKAETLF
jgi:hypothetical protein